MSGAAGGPGLLEALAGARRAEREQAQYYRGLAAEAERREDAPLAERLNELHADEQHHLSRLTARLLELGEQPAPLGSAQDEPTLEQWETEARRREHEEVRRYEALLELDMDEATRELLVEILRSERLHAENLGGKWMGA